MEQFAGVRVLTLDSQENPERSQAGRRNGHVYVPRSIEWAFPRRMPWRKSRAEVRLRFSIWTSSSFRNSVPQATIAAPELWCSKVPGGSESPETSAGWAFQMRNV